MDTFQHDETRATGENLMQAVGATAATSKLAKTCKTASTPKDRQSSACVGCKHRLARLIDL